MAELNISKDLKLPLNAVTRRLAFLGTVGSGKTYAATKLAELMVEHKAQIVVIDPVGIWYGLRLAANGKDPGLSIPVLGGLHGDIPLEPTAGALVADLIVDRRISVVLDVSQFEYDTDRARFCADFGARLFFRKKSKPSALHLFLEEAQEVMPQNPQRGEERMLHVFIRIWKIGRNFGIGGSLISQRPQEVNKKGLNLSQCLFAFQTMGKHERKAIEEWIEDKALNLDMANDLPKLKVGCPHVWAPDWLGISEGVKISKKWTFDASATPEVGESAEVRELAPIDLAKLSDQMKATIERAKEQDPELLKKRIRELEAEQKRVPAQTPVKQADLKKIADEARASAMKEVERYKGKVITRLQKLGIHANRMVQESKDFAELVSTKFPELSETVTIVVPDQTQADMDRIRGIWAKPGRASVYPPATFEPITTRKADGSLPIGERKILIAIAQHEQAERNQLTVLTGYKRSSLNTYLQRLTEKGFLDIRSLGFYSVSRAGMDALGDFQPLPVGRELIEHHKTRLPEGERALFAYLVEAYPRVVSRDELGERTNYKRSSVNTYLQRLGARRLIESTTAGVSASKRLFT